MKRSAFIVLVGVAVLVGGRLSNQPPVNAEGVGDNTHSTQHGDVNCDDQVDIADAIYIINWRFLGGPDLCQFTAPCEEQVAVLEEQLAAAQVQVTACNQNLEATEEDLRAVQATLAAAEADLELCRSQIGIPDTGQTTCFDSAGGVTSCTDARFLGQDGFYVTGCPTEGRFLDNEDGTVTDTCTGLMWQKDTGNGGASLNWSSALAYCENLELAGHDDWRLPNVRELQSIVDYGRFEPAIYPLFGVLSSSYWSSTSIAGYPQDAWRVLFNVGSMVSRYKLSNALVRAVRTNS